MEIVSNEINTIATGHLVIHFAEIDFTQSLSGRCRYLVFPTSAAWMLHTNTLEFFVFRFHKFKHLHKKSSLSNVFYQEHAESGSIDVENKEHVFSPWKVLWSIWPITLHMIMKKPSKNVLATKYLNAGVWPKKIHTLAMNVCTFIDDLFVCVVHVSSVWL